MSQEVEIIEGARGRSFSRVNRIKTDKQDGGACFWVPENERRLTSLPAFQNGEYEPGNGYYAFDSVDASVMHFDDFDINIDDDDLPHIDLDGIDITIDETGIPHINFDYEVITVDDETIKVIYPDGKEVIIHGPDLDGVINIDDVFTIDYDKETGTWKITAITDVTSGGNEYGPGDIVAQWPGTEYVDIHIGESISVPDLGDIDFDADIDVSVDLDDMDVDISGIDMDGLDVDVNIDLDTLDMNTFDLPDEIRIMHVPNKTSYKDGEEIDLDGLVVQAYRNGEVWEDKEGKYYNGYVPVHELNIDPLIAHEKNKYRPGSTSVHTEMTYTRYGVHWHDVFERTCGIDTGMALVLSGNDIHMWLADTSDKDGYGIWKNVYDGDGEVEEHKGDSFYGTHQTFIRNGKRIYYGGPYWMGHVSSPYTHPSYENVVVQYSIDGNIIVVDGHEDLYEFLYELACGDVTSVTVSWPRPHDNKILTASFDISVEEGATQTGGTTTSGDHGGSHSSGNF